jgi:predicted  nucleic acid-binding Zn-ribbon protein
MSDADKLDKVQNFVQKWVSWAKQNTMIAGIVITGIPAIGAAGYTAITKFNEVKAMYEDFDSVASNASSAKRKVEALEEKVQELRENNIKLQERLNYAVIDAREAKVVSESTQKELRSGLAAQKVELEVTANSLKNEMNAVRRATTNRLGQ